jgi:hypothetical protein
MKFSVGYILAPVDLAHEYVKLSKMKHAASIFNQTLNSIKSGQASDEASALFFLRFAESLVTSLHWRMPLEGKLHVLHFRLKHECALRGSCAF